MTSGLDETNQAATGTQRRAKGPKSFQQGTPAALPMRSCMAVPSPSEVESLRWSKGEVPR
jgi:hypothetical protein